MQQFKFYKYIKIVSCLMILKHFKIFIINKSIIIIKEIESSLKLIKYIIL